MRRPWVLASGLCQKVKKRRSINKMLLQGEVKDELSVLTNQRAMACVTVTHQIARYGRRSQKSNKFWPSFLVCVTPGDGSWRLGSERENLQVARLKQIQQTLCDLKESDS